MTNYLVRYTVQLPGEIVVEAASEEEAEAAVEGVTDAELVENAELGAGSLEIEQTLEYTG